MRVDGGGDEAVEVGAMDGGAERLVALDDLRVRVAEAVGQPAREEGVQWGGVLQQRGGAGGLRAMMWNLHHCGLRNAA